MEKSTLIELIRDYSGNIVYLKTLQQFLLKGNSLTETQLHLAKALLIKNAINKNDKSLLPTEVLKEFNIEWIKYSHKSPYEFQKQGINWLLNKDRAILADDLGLGKSLQATIAALETSCKKILIVCPATLKLNWLAEISPFEKSISIIDKKWSPARFTIINYDKLHTFSAHIIKEKFEILIADEAHYVKNLQSRRSKHLSKISKKIKRVWLLTGTPIANKPIDFYNLLKICKHELGQRKTEYAQRFCGGVLTPWGWDTSGASNLKELHFKTQNVIFRRTKDKVLDLPEKTRVPVLLELRNKKAYDHSLEDYFDKRYNLSLDEEQEYYGSNLEAGQHLVELSVLRRFAALEKIRDNSTIELIENVLEQGKKIVVFTNYLEVIDLLFEKVKNRGSVVIDGRISLAQRQANIEKFQTDPNCNIIICNSKIASVGITLTAAQVAIVNDLDWSPANIIQAEDRLYRIGQKNAVTIYYLLYVNTIDSVMFEAIQEKIKNITTAVEGKEITTFNLIEHVFSKLFTK